MLQLFQAEWCPRSSAVRQRLTELGVDFVARQVAADPDDRVGEIEIPTLLGDAGERVTGGEEIIAWLDERFEERPDARRHRAKSRVQR